MDLLHQLPSANPPATHNRQHNVWPGECYIYSDILQRGISQIQDARKQEDCMQNTRILEARNHNAIPLGALIATLESLSLFERLKFTEPEVALKVRKLLNIKSYKIPKPSPNDPI